jgi:hypothetical protein
MGEGCEFFTKSLYQIFVILTIQEIHEHTAYYQLSAPHTILVSAADASLPPNFLNNFSKDPPD